VWLVLSPCTYLHTYVAKWILKMLVSKKFCEGFPVPLCPTCGEYIQLRGTAFQCRLPNYRPPKCRQGYENVFLVSDPLCLSSSSSALHFFRLLVLVHHLVLPGWPASPCTCNGLWLLSCMAVSLKENNWLITKMCFNMTVYLLLKLNWQPTAGVRW
jgi:hypothetical protein